MLKFFSCALYCSCTLLNCAGCCLHYCAFCCICELYIAVLHYIADMHICIILLCSPHLCILDCPSWCSHALYLCIIMQLCIALQLCIVLQLLRLSCAGFKFPFHYRRLLHSLGPAARFDDHNEVHHICLCICLCVISFVFILAPTGPTFQICWSQWSSSHLPMSLSLCIHICTHRAHLPDLTITMQFQYHHDHGGCWCYKDADDNIAVEIRLKRIRFAPICICFCIFVFVFVFASERYSLVAGDRGACVSDLHWLQLSDLLWISIFQRLRFSMGCSCHLLVNFFCDQKLEMKDILTLN